MLYFSSEWGSFGASRLTHPILVEKYHYASFYVFIFYVSVLYIIFLRNFLVDKKYKFQVGGRVDQKKKLKAGELCACDMIEVGEGGQVPLWLFGFLF